MAIKVVTWWRPDLMADVTWSCNTWCSVVGHCCDLGIDQSGICVCKLCRHGEGRVFTCQGRYSCGDPMSVGFDASGPCSSCGVWRRLMVKRWWFVHFWDSVENSSQGGVCWVDVSNLVCSMFMTNFGDHIQLGIQVQGEASWVWCFMVRGNRASRDIGLRGGLLGFKPIWVWSGLKPDWVHHVGTRRNLPLETIEFWASLLLWRGVQVLLMLLICC